MYNRQIQQNIIEKLQDNRILILYGPRRVGKTTITKIISTIIPETKYFNCEEFDFQNGFSETKTSNELRTYLGDGDLFILDEAQSVLNIGRKLKLLIDQYPEIKILATGSSSFDLANKINEPLTGRKWEFKLFPLSIGEIKTNNIERIDRILKNLLIYGSYPQVIQDNFANAENILKELATSYLYKDILNFEDVKNPELLTKLLQALALQVGNEVSYTEVASLIGTDHETVQRYIDLLEKALVIFRLKSLSRNSRDEIKKTRKIYFYDLGIRNSIINNFNQLELRSDVGALWENFCIVERLKFLTYNQINVNSYFWRTYSMAEVDYIEERNGNLYAFEFKWNENRKSKWKKNFSESYPDSKFMNVTPANLEEFINLSYGKI